MRCLTRRPELTEGRFGPDTEVVAGDVLDQASMRRAMAGVDAACYLVHALGSRGHFEQEEERAARSFVAAAREAGVRRIVYLGGLAHPDELARQAGAGGSAHMCSRLRVGELLRGSGVPTVELRASIVIGAGSLSFELIRALVQRLPVMVTPRWVSVEAQPIAVSDVIACLVAALDRPLDASRVFEIGGAEVTSYRGLMEEYARQRGLRRLFVPVPFLTPHVSSLWLGLVTPIFARVGRKLIESITMPSVVRDRGALEVFPVRPCGYREAIRRALADEDARLVATRWSDALSISAGGWYYANALWRLRGVLDRMLGGVGMKRGRRDPEDLRAGDVLDCWRVVACEAPRVLSLEAEMRLPGRAWLQFEVTPCPQGASIRQTAVFDPVGLGGLVYWYVLYLPHLLIFRGMLVAVAERAGVADGQ